MNCLKHENREAIAMCVKCHKLICEECAVKINNKYYCKECISEMYSNKENEIYNKNEVIDDFQHLNDNDESNLFLNTNVDFQSNINKNVSNKSFIRYKGIGSILGVIAIVILIPRVISAFNEFGNCFENMYISFRYDSGVRAFLFLINSILILAQPLILIALSALLFSDFIKFKKTISIITPIIIVSVFTLLIFIIGSIAIRFIDFIPFIDLIYYIIPVILIIIGNCINEK